MEPRKTTIVHPPKTPRPATTIRLNVKPPISTMKTSDINNEINKAQSHFIVTKNSPENLLPRFNVVKKSPEKSPNLDSKTAVSKTGNSINAETRNSNFISTRSFSSDSNNSPNNSNSSANSSSNSSSNSNSSNNLNNDLGSPKTPPTPIISSIINSNTQSLSFSSSSSSSSSYSSSISSPTIEPETVITSPIIPSTSNTSTPLLSISSSNSSSSSSSSDYSSSISSLTSNETDAPAPFTISNIISSDKKPTAPQVFTKEEITAHLEKMQKTAISLDAKSEISQDINKARESALDSFVKKIEASHIETLQEEFRTLKLLDQLALENLQISSNSTKQQRQNAIKTVKEKIIEVYTKYADSTLTTKEALDLLKTTVRQKEVETTEDHNKTGWLTSWRNPIGFLYAPVRLFYPHKSRLASQFDQTLKNVEAAADVLPSPGISKP